MYLEFTSIKNFQNTNFSLENTSLLVDIRGKWLCHIKCMTSLTIVSSSLYCLSRTDENLSAYIYIQNIDI